MVLATLEQEILRRKRKPNVRKLEETKQGTSLRTYLRPLVSYSLKVGCRIESSICRWRQKEIVVLDGLREPLTALLSAVPNIPPVAFDSDSYPIGVD